MAFRKNLVDGGMIIFTIMGLLLIYFIENDVWGVSALVLAILIGWFRRAIYRALR